MTPYRCLLESLLWRHDAAWMVVFTFRCPSCGGTSWWKQTKSHQSLVVVHGCNNCDQRWELSGYLRKQVDPWNAWHILKGRTPKGVPYFDTQAPLPSVVPPAWTPQRGLQPRYRYIPGTTTAGRVLNGMGPFGTLPFIPDHVGRVILRDLLEGRSG